MSDKKKKFCLTANVNDKKFFSTCSFICKIKCLISEFALYQGLLAIFSTFLLPQKMVSFLSLPLQYPFLSPFISFHFPSSFSCIYKCLQLPYLSLLSSFRLPFHLRIVSICCFFFPSSPVCCLVCFHHSYKGAPLYISVSIFIT